MSKYAAVLPDLPRLPAADAPYQERVNQHKMTLNTLDAIKLAELYTEHRREKDRLDDEVKALNLKIEAVTQMLVRSQSDGEEAWGQYGVKDNAIRLPNGDTVRVKSEPYGQVKDKEAFRLWCIANGYERQLQLWPATMNALAKERRLSGEPDPDGVEVFRKDSLVFVPKGAEAAE